ncbi:hypothetical protein NE237_018531 [Protea cynaroides]|uniref:Uncharacterized protein n=1 Tax=Protea cynaroides TaxID=273540 RepID=A0A9Q0KA49_9MAGN|nr:hypothetical protein NE237_018531 [Protea cynaroides]
MNSKENMEEMSKELNKLLEETKRKNTKLSTLIKKFYSDVGVGQTESLRHHGDIPVWAGDMKDKAMHPRTRKRRKRGVAAIRCSRLLSNSNAIWTLPRQNLAFDEYSWKSISPSAKQLISSLLAVDPCRRPIAQEVNWPNIWHYPDLSVQHKFIILFICLSDMKKEPDTRFCFIY